MKQIVLESTTIASQVVAKSARTLSDCVTSLAFDPYEELLWSGSRSVSFFKLNKLLFSNFNFLILFDWCCFGLFLTHFLFSQFLFLILAIKVKSVYSVSIF